MIPKEAARTAYHLRILNCLLRTSEFHKRLELMTMCKNLVIIWVTFPQFCASEIIWPTIDAIFLTWMKGEVFKLTQTVFRSEHILFILGSTASMKPLSVSMKSYPWKGAGGLPDRFLVIYARTKVNEIRTNQRTTSFCCLQRRTSTNTVIKKYSYSNALCSPMDLQGLQQFSENIRGRRNPTGIMYDRSQTHVKAKNLRCSGKITTWWYPDFKSKEKTK